MEDCYFLLQLMIIAQHPYYNERASALRHPLTWLIKAPRSRVDGRNLTDYDMKSYTKVARMLCLLLQDFYILGLQVNSRLGF
jgi:hypothetical protein